MSDKEVSELEGYIEALERVEATDKVFWVSPGNVAKILRVLHSELQDIKGRLEKLENAYNSNIHPHNLDVNPESRAEAPFNKVETTVLGSHSNSKNYGNALPKRKHRPQS